MSADTPSILDDLSRPRTRARSSASIPESEDTIRNLKASESVQAAFQASGIPSPPGDVAAIITNHVKSAIQGLPLSQVANMSSGSGELSTAAVAGVNMFMNSLTPSQRDAVKAGVNPLDSTAMMKIGGLFKADAGNFARLAGRDGVDSSARYDGMGAGGLNQIQLQARDLAIKSGLTWAANNPDLLRLGPAAIEILAQTKLREETFNRLTKDAGLSTKGAVGVAAMLHAQGKDANKDGQALAADIAAINDPAFKAAIDARGRLQVPAPNETPEQKKVREAQMPAAEDQVRAAADAHVQRKPEDAARVKRATETLGIAVKKNEVQAAATQSAEQQNQNRQAFFSSEPASSSAAAPKPDAPAAATSSAPAAATSPKPDASVAKPARSLAPPKP